MQANPSAGFAEMQSRLRDRRERNWVNLGGQLTSAAEVDRLRADIGDGKLDTWQQIHQRYDQLWEKYPLEKQKHALATLCALCGAEDLTGPQWIDALNRAASIQDLIRDRVYDSRRKDFENPFRQATFRNTEEMLATIGTVEENDFVRQIREDSEQFKTIIRELIQRG